MLNSNGQSVMALQHQPLLSQKMAGSESTHWTVVIFEKSPRHLKTSIAAIIAQRKGVKYGFNAKAWRSTANSVIESTIGPSSSPLLRSRS